MGQASSIGCCGERVKNPHIHTKSQARPHIYSTFMPDKCIGLDADIYMLLCSIHPLDCVVSPCANVLLTPRFKSIDIALSSYNHCDYGGGVETIYIDVSISNAVLYFSSGSVVVVESDTFSLVLTLKISRIDGRHDVKILKMNFSEIVVSPANESGINCEELANIKISWLNSFRVFLTDVMVPLLNERPSPSSCFYDFV